MWLVRNSTAQRNYVNADTVCSCRASCRCVYAHDPVKAAHERNYTQFAGLIDKSEDAEQAAIRELEEETGFKAAGILQTSPILVCDPGQDILAAPCHTSF